MDIPPRGAGEGTASADTAPDMVQRLVAAARLRLQEEEPASLGASDAAGIGPAGLASALSETRRSRAEAQGQREAAAIREWATASAIHILSDAWERADRLVGQTEDDIAVVWAEVQVAIDERLAQAQAELDEARAQVDRAQDEAAEIRTRSAAEAADERAAAQRLATEARSRAADQLKREIQEIRSSVHADVASSLAAASERSRRLAAIRPGETELDLAPAPAGSGTPATGVQDFDATRSPGAGPGAAGEGMSFATGTSTCNTPLPAVDDAIAPDRSPSRGEMHVNVVASRAMVGAPGSAWVGPRPPLPPSLPLASEGGVIFHSPPLPLAPPTVAVDPAPERRSGLSHWFRRRRRPHRTPSR